MDNRSKSDDFKENQAMRHLSEIAREAINAPHGQPTTRKIGNATTVYQRRVRRVQTLDYPNMKTKRRSSQRKTLGTDIHVFKLQSCSYRGVGNDEDGLAFICALRKFFALRGPSFLLRCDRGTNFIGGKSELDQALSALNQKVITKYVTEQDCEWIFNPPHALHFGGVRERQIGTVLQSHQKRTKWNERQPNLTEEDIVIMKEQIPRNQWLLGRVVEAILSKDGKVRKAKIAISRDGKKNESNLFL